ncbi:restriction endonuclease subunit S [Lacticaseibacillus paracasei]|uniref:restriction endonuclease subunit S n=1 Tax=Lacticaseibacillus paracasei TaxID=1597 RepID=UPI00202EB455|nr:restriction endonuclease subunit S [Lacticaseibacillus paracasei]URW90658.1 restriction endonuclease subunit S [Lacticaseibacillus paracasei]
MRINKTSDDSMIPSVEFEDIISKQGRLNKDVRLKINSKQGIYFEPQDVLFGKLRPYLQNWLFPSFYGRAVGDFWVLRANSSLLSEYLFVLIQSPRFQSVANISAGTKMPRSDWNTVSNTSFSIPVQSEQRRIGQLFNVLDDLIAATQDKIDAFEQIKKALLQHLFDQSWRFKEYSELWTPHLLGEITSKVTEKNTENLYHETFTNSAKYGIVEQQSFFDKSISNEANLANYYVVRENDFVYNPRISNSAPIGPVRRNKLNRTGVMSPLYYVFRATTAVYPIFLEYFFKGESWYRFMYLNGDTGARSDRFAIKDKVFEQMPVKLPEKSEQEKIGALLQNLETVMNQTQERLQKIRDIKDSLLKSLFV